ncbi:MAG: acetyltransferase [Anaerocolumna sp.]|nr:acetyltransferase [Anaerocolumna sp.]
MLFSSYTFLFLFLPAVVGLFYLTKKLAGEGISLVFLVIASLVFYGIFYPGFLLILTASIAINLVFAILIKETAAWCKFIYIIGILANIIGLVFLKYTDILNGNLLEYFPQNIVALDLVFPLGVGFLTFNQISYLTQVYKKELSRIFSLDYCLKCTFFPSLVMGPVYRFKDNLLTNENDELTKSFDFVAYGIYILIIGLFKMVVLADSLYIYVFNGLNISNPGLLTSWLTLVSFTLQIYFYFSGYCDMSVGIGKIFGLNIPYNFLSPYKAVSLRDFSKRWQVSLTGIIKDVIYTPLTSKYKNKMILFVAIIASAVIGSLWYGVSTNVLIFGLAFGILLFAESLFDNIITHIPKLIRGGITFLIINLLFMLLPTDSISRTIHIYKGLIDFGNLGINQISELTDEGSLYFPDFVNVGYFLVTIILGTVMCFLCKNTKEIMKRASLTIISAIGLGLLFLIIVMHLTRLEFLF